MAEEVFLDLAREDVLAAADHHVLDAADDVAIALVVDGGEVARVHPAFGVDGFGGLFGIVPVANHDGITPRAEFARLAARDGGALLVDDLDFKMRLDAADGGNAAFERVVDRGLEGDWRGLRHAIADADLMHVHAVDHLLHHLDRTRRAGHYACPERAEIELVEVGVFEFGDEHGGHAVEAGAAFGFDRLENCERFVAFGGVDHRGPVDDAGEIAHHHAEAVIERHRDQQAVSGFQPHPLAHEESVVEDVAVGERRALRQAGRAGGELDVDRVVAVEVRGDGLCLLYMHVGRERRNVGERAPAWRWFAADLDDVAKRRQALRAKLSRVRGRDLWGEFVDHRDIVRGLEIFGADQSLHTDLVERVFDLGQAVSGIDIDLNEADAGGGELDQRPLSAIGRPDADAISRLEVKGEEAGGEAINRVGELLVGPADALMHGNERFLHGPRPRGAQEGLADGVFEQRGFRDAAHEAELAHVSLPERRVACSGRRPRRRAMVAPVLCAEPGTGPTSAGPGARFVERCGPCRSRPQSTT